MIEQRRITYLVEAVAEGRGTRSIADALAARKNLQMNSTQAKSRVLRRSFTICSTPATNLDRGKTSKRSADFGAKHRRIGPSSPKCLGQFDWIESFPKWECRIT